VRGSYSIAGLVTAVFALGASVAGPVWGGLLDRRGQPWVIGPVAAVSAVLLAALAVCTVRGAGDPVLIGLALAVGVTNPPISPAMRGAWRWALPAEDDRRAAYALDAVAVETIFVGGPLLLSVLLVLAPPVVPLLVTAALLLIGGVGYATSPAARGWRPEPHRHGPDHRGRSPLRVPAVAVTLLVSTAIAIGFGLCDVSIAATAREVLGNQAQVGLLFMSIAGGSAAGGLWYGSRHWKGDERDRLAPALGGFGTGLLLVGTLVALGRTELYVLMPVLFGAGLCIAPSLIILAHLIDHHGPADRRAEGQAWLNASFTSGGALGTGLAGLLVDVGGPGRAFLGAGAAVAVALLATLAVGSGRWVSPR